MTMRFVCAKLPQIPLEILFLLLKHSAMIGYDAKIRVRYGETDKMGFLYHAHYLDYYDVARTETLRSVGLSNLELEQAGFRLPVIEAAIRYSRPAHYDDLLTVRCLLPQMPGVKLRFDYKVYREKEGNPLGELINTGHTVLGFTDASTGRACRPPEWFQEALGPYFTRTNP
jgi:acyl-CoA thioester hydrolase